MTVSLHTPTGNEFAHIALMLMRSGGDAIQAAVMAESAAPPRVAAILKTAVAAGSLADAAWAGALGPYSLVVGSFIESLRNSSAFDRMLPDMRRLPLRSRIVAITAGATGSSVAEGMAKPLTSLALSSDPIEPVKSFAIVVLSDEILRAAGSAAVAFLNSELKRAVGAATDGTFLAGIADGITALASAGETAADARADFRALFFGIELGATSRPYIIMTSTLAKQLAFKETTGGAAAFPDMSPLGGMIGGVPVLVSDGLADGTIMALDATAISADSDTVTLATASAGSLQMDDAPGSGAQQHVSLFQTNCKAIKAERFFGFTRIGSGRSVAVMENVSYNDLQSGP